MGGEAGLLKAMQTFIFKIMEVTMRGQNLINKIIY